MPLARSLRVKLTFFYAGLFCLALMLIGAIAYAVIGSNAQRLVREQMEATGVVFDRVWELRFEQLRDGARLASRDYGFREAVATRDDATIRSALANLRQRLGAGLVFLVTPEGAVVGDAAAGANVSPGLQAALEREDAPVGVLSNGGALYQAVTMPVLAPNMIGVIVVGERLDEREMSALEQLSSIPLQAEVLQRTPRGWALRDQADRPLLGAFLDRGADGGAIDVLQEAGGPAMALVKPLHSLDGARSALLLRYPLASALAPYRALFGSLFAIGFAGLALLAASAWFLAAGITRPLSSLADAARKVQQGVFEPVDVKTNDEIAHLAGSFNTMIGALKDRERRIIHLAMHDAETGLPNRLALERKLGEQASPKLYLAAVGVDRFAQVRAAIGYAHAEGLIRRLGQRLKKLIPGSLTARIASDALAVTFLAENDADAGRRAAALVANLEQPLSLERQVVDVNVSIGLSPPRAAKETAASAIKKASIALDQARNAHVKYAIFDEAAYGNPAHNLSLMGEMRRALTDGSIFLTHQPKFNFRTRRIDGGECLVRWRHPTRGMISPDVFVPMAEETGHIRALTDWVLQRAIEEQAALQQAGWPLTVSVNISGRLLSDPDFTHAALAAASKAGGKLCFEITETAVIDNPTAALKHIDLFVENGISIAIDDYGSGLSSLAYLRQLPAQELKIDKMFVQNLTNSQRDALLVRSTIELAHGLGLKVTAEGVETPAAFALLASMGCDMAQGHLISRPLTMAELIPVLSAAPSADYLKSPGDLSVQG